MCDCRRIRACGRLRRVGGIGPIGGTSTHHHHHNQTQHHDRPLSGRGEDAHDGKLVQEVLHPPHAPLHPVVLPPVCVALLWVCGGSRRTYDPPNPNQTPPKNNPSPPPHIHIHTYLPQRAVPEVKLEELPIQGRQEVAAPAHAPHVQLRGALDRPPALNALGMCVVSWVCWGSVACDARGPLPWTSTPTTSRHD